VCSAVTRFRRVEVEDADVDDVGDASAGCGDVDIIIFRDRRCGLVDNGGKAWEDLALKKGGTETLRYDGELRRQVLEVWSVTYRLPVGGVAR
jgi:hypothetical protein